MVMSSSPFAVAERYIQLRRIYQSPSWGDFAIRINELIVGPLIALMLLLLGRLDVLSLATAIWNAYRSWTDWSEYWTLRLQMQQMYLITMKTGGPHIVTNDPTYLPYVYADAVVRDDMRRRGSERVRH
jgi:hypothetical protein